MTRALWVVEEKAGSEWVMISWFPTREEAKEVAQEINQPKDKIRIVQYVPKEKR